MGEATCQGAGAKSRVAVVERLSFGYAVLRLDVRFFGKRLQGPPRIFLNPTPSPPGCAELISVQGDQPNQRRTAVTCPSCQMWQMMFLDAEAALRVPEAILLSYSDINTSFVLPHAFIQRKGKQCPL